MGRGKWSQVGGWRRLPGVRWWGSGVQGVIRTLSLWLLAASLALVALGPSGQCDLYGSIDGVEPLPPGPSGPPGPPGPQEAGEDGVEAALGQLQGTVTVLGAGWPTGCRQATGCLKTLNT